MREGSAARMLPGGQRIPPGFKLLSSRYAQNQHRHKSLSEKLIERGDANIKHNNLTVIQHPEDSAFKVT